jgi:hypothetical protein
MIAMIVPTAMSTRACARSFLVDFFSLGLFIYKVPSHVGRVDLSNGFEITEKCLLHLCPWGRVNFIFISKVITKVITE